jgi:hypothetical protein
MCACSKEIEVFSSWLKDWSFSEVDEDGMSGVLLLHGNEVYRMILLQCSTQVFRLISWINIWTIS